MQDSYARAMGAARVGAGRQGQRGRSPDRQGVLRQDRGPDAGQGRGTARGGGGANGPFGGQPGAVRERAAGAHRRARGAGARRRVDQGRIPRRPGSAGRGERRGAPTAGARHGARPRHAPTGLQDDCRAGAPDRRARHDAPARRRAGPPRQGEVAHRRRAHLDQRREVLQPRPTTGAAAAPSTW